MIRPLSIGNKSFPVNLIQGPLAGTTCAPFRALTWAYSQPAFSCSEMISCKTLLYQSALMQKRFITKDPTEGPVSFQLAGSDPYEISEAAKKITDYGAELIDLNCGCPMKKIRKKGAGSSLLTDPIQLYKIITALKNNTTVPVSIKIRIPEKGNESFNLEIAKIISEAGADCLIVHGRHWTEQYETPCRYDEIKFFVEALKIPVIGNGDVKCIASLKKMFATGCAGVMISRAGVGQPWLIRKLIAEMQQEKYLEPSPQEVGEILIKHATGLHALLNNEKLAVLQTRKFAKYYARNIENKMAFCAAINKCTTLGDFKKIVLCGSQINDRI